MMRILLLTLMMIFLPAQAMQKFAVKDQGRVEVKISNTGVNRIALINDRIKAIYGGQNQAQFVTDEETGQAFVTTHSAEPFGVSLITESNFTVDLTLQPVQTTSETILLDINPDDREIEALIAAANKPAKPRAIKGATYVSTYFGLTYKATVFNYTNAKAAAETLKEETFNVPGGRVVIERPELKPKASTKIIIVEPNA